MIDEKSIAFFKSNVNNLIHRIESFCIPLLNNKINFAGLKKILTIAQNKIHEYLPTS